MAYGSARYNSYKIKNNGIKMSDVQASRVGLKNNGSALGYLGGNLAAGIGGVGEGIADIFSAAGSLLTGDTDGAKYVFKDNVVGEWHRSMTEEYNPTGVMQFFGDVTHGIGQSSVFLLNAIPGLGQLGTVAFFGGITGQGISNAAEMTGDVGAKEIAYGVLSGATEAALEAVSGGTAKLAKNIGQGFVKNATRTAVRKGLLRQVLSDAAGEFLEEFAGEYTDTFWQRVTQVNPDAEYSFKNAVYSGLVGFVSGGVTAGAGSVASFTGNRIAGKRIIDGGNSQTLVNTATFVADKLAGSGTDFKNAADWVQMLRGQVNAYNKLSADAKVGAKGQTILGEMQTSLMLAEMQATFSGVQKKIETADEGKRAEWAKYINEAITADKRNKTYTAEDIAKNTDNIAWQLAIIDYVNGIADIDSIVDNEDFVNENLTEAQRAAQETQETTQEATQEVTDGQGVVQGTASQGGTVDGNVGQNIATEANVQGQRAAQGTASQGGAVDGNVGQNIAAEANIQGQRTAQGTASEKNTAGNATAAQEAEGQQGTAKQTENISDRAERFKRWKEITSYSAKDLNTARKMVKNFDNLSVEDRLRVMRIIKSGEGVDAKTVKGVANLMLYADGLNFRFTEGIGDRGLYIKEERGEVIFVNKDSAFKDVIRNTVAHELTHFLEGKKGYAKLAAYVMKHAKPEAAEKYRKQYTDYYRKQLMEKLTGNSQDGKNWDDLPDSFKNKIEERINSKEMQELIESEVTASLVGSALFNERFLQRYARMNDGGFKRAFNFLKDLCAYIKTKDKETYTEVNKIIALVEVAMLSEQKNAADGAVVRKKSFAGERASTADKMKLATAKEMLENGADSETVRKETGWFKGYDGKWRFEIDDFDSSLIENPKLERHEDDGDVYFTGKLSDIFNHKELFKAYPELNDINIVIQKTDFGIEGIYQPNSNYITLSLQQFQRYKKEYYDFLNGGRKSEIEAIERSPEYQEYNKYYDDEVMDEMDPTEWLEAETRARNKFFSSEIGKRYYQLRWGKENYRGDKFEFGWNKEAKAVLLHEIQHAIQKFEGFAYGTNTRDKNYDKNAGEIEARDVAKRADLTAEERKNTRPDVDREDVVFAESVDKSLSIAVTENGKPVVVVNDDITRYTSNDKDLVKLVKQSIGKLPYVAIGKQKIKFLYDTKREVTFSRYTQWLRKNAPDVYKDKMRLFSHPSEIILATTNYINEGLTHPRTDDIIDFARGEILVDILGNQYSAEVVIGFTKSGVCELHDVVNMIPISFKYKTRDALSAISYNDEHSQKRSPLNNSISQKQDLSTDFAKKSENNFSKVKKKALAEPGEDANAKKQAVKDATLTGQMAQDRKDAAELLRVKESLKAERSKSNRYKAENMSMAKLLAKESLDEQAKTYTKKEVAELIRRMGEYDPEFLATVADGRDTSISKADKEQFFYDLYISLQMSSHDKHIANRLDAIAVDLSKQYLDSIYFKDETGKREYLKDLVDGESYDGYVRTYAKRLISSFKEMGSETGYAKAMSKLRAVQEKARRKILDGEEKGKNFLELISKARKLREEVKGAKRDGTHNEGVIAIEQELSKIANERGSLNIKQADKAFSLLNTFLESEAEKAKEDTIVDFDSYAPMLDLLQEYAHIREGRRGKYFNAKEMKLAAKIIQAGRKMLRDYNKVYMDGHWVDIDSAVDESVKDIEDLFGTDKEYRTKVGEWFGKALKGVKQAYFYYVLTPETVIGSLEGYRKGGVLTTLYHEIRVAKQRAEHRAVRMKKPFAEFLDDKENRWVDGNGRSISFRKKLNDKKVNVNGYEISLGESIYLYMLTKREEALAGLQDGGYMIYDDSNNEVQGFKVLDPEAAADMIFSQLDDTDKKFLAMAEEFFNVTASEIKRAADMHIFGFTNIIDGYYVPMIRDRYSRMGAVTDIRQSVGYIITVYNKSFNQTLVKNAKPLEGKNIMSIINDHADGLADYAEMFLPLKAFDRVYNRQLQDANGMTTSLRKELNTKVWRDTDDYLKYLFQDIQGQSRGGDKIADRIVGRLRSGWVNSVLGLNIKVVVTQTTSIAAANQVIEMKYLAPALSKLLGSDSELSARADEYSDIIEARSFDMGAIKSMGNVDKLNEFGRKTGFMIEWMDRRVCQVIFHAAELKVQDIKGYAVGTPENAKAAAKIADEAIYTTQAMTSKAERSALQRSPNEVTKTLSMFTSDSVKNLSHFVGNVMQYFAHKQRADAGDAMYAAELSKDAKKIGRSATTLVMIGVMLGVISQAFKYLYAKEEDEPEDKIKDAAEDILSSTLNILPIISDITDKFVFGYDLSLNVFDIANDSIEDISALFSKVGRAMGGQYVSKQEWGGSVVNLVKTLGTAFGAPVAPLERTITGLMRRFAPSTMYGYDAMLYSPSYTADLKKAVEGGDERLAEHILMTLYKNEVSGTYTSAELEEVARLYQSGYTSVLPQKVGTTVNDVKLTREQRKKFNSIYSKASSKVTDLIASQEFKELTDEQKAKAIKNLYSMYYAKAASEVAGKDWTRAVAYSYLTDNYTALYLAQAYKSGLEAYEGKGGKQVTVKEQFLDYANNLGLSDADYLVITYANGVRDKTATARLIEYINSLSLDGDVKAKIADRLGFAVKNGVVCEADK